YCYARDYHARRGRDTGAGFDREIDVKINFPELLTQELRRIRKRETVALGTATDPYQQCEGRYRITRRTLEALVASPLPVIVITKGSMVVRDIDLLARLDVKVCVSIGTVSAELARTSEPHASPPNARLEAVRRLVSAGIDAGVLAAPILPGLSDSEESLDAVASAAASSGATFFSTRPLKLDPSVKPHYLAFLSEHFPALLPSIEARYAACRSSQGRPSTRRCSSGRPPRRCSGARSIRPDASGRRPGRAHSLGRRAWRGDRHRRATSPRPRRSRLRASLLTRRARAIA